MESDEQKRLIESVLLSEDEQKWGFTYSTLYTNDQGPGAIWLVENLKKKAELIKSKQWVGASSISTLIENRVHAMRLGLVGTRSRDARFIDAVTVQRTKYAVQSPEQAKGLGKLLQMNPPQQQQQQGMF